MTICAGDRFKSHFTGKLYKVKAIRNSRAMLEAEDGLSQVVTEKDNLNLFYAKISERDKQAPLSRP